MIIVIETRPETVGKEDVVPAIAVIIDGRNTARPKPDHFVLGWFPFGQRPHRIMVRDEINPRGLCDVSESPAIAGHGFAVNQFLFGYFPLPEIGRASCRERVEISIGNE